MQGWRGVEGSLDVRDKVFGSGGVAVLGCNGASLSFPRLRKRGVRERVREG